MKQHQCSYSGGYCIHCLSKQPTIRNGKEVSPNIVFDRKIAPTPQILTKKIHSENQYATDQLITFLGVPVKEFARYAKYVKKLGPEKIHGIIKDIKSVDAWTHAQHNCKLNKIGYFINKYVKVNKTK